MQIQEIIRRKRDGKTLSAGELDFMARGIADGSISEGQGAAFAMAVYFRGMETGETAHWTHAMRDSGDVLAWPKDRFNGPIIDKHSTGGVGDKVSLMLAPMLAACGAIVPMISGRGLGHTGGTLDKLEAIPGFRTDLDPRALETVIHLAGCAIVGASARIAPADRVLYGIRDVTATVDSIPLITASILSKKMAAGLEGLVLDVKTGSGAFASSMEMARELATSLVDVSNASGLPARALVTDMNQVLGTTAGNALEVEEALDYLVNGGGEQRLDQVTMALGAEALLLGGLAADEKAAGEMLGRVLSSGEAAEQFAKMAKAQGGPGDLLDSYRRQLPRAAVVRPVESTAAGFVRGMDVRELGMAVVGMGGGREVPDSVIDPGVGLSGIIGVGQAVEEGQPLAVVHVGDESDYLATRDRIIAAIDIGNEPGHTGTIYPFSDTRSAG